MGGIPVPLYLEEDTDTESLTTPQTQSESPSESYHLQETPTIAKRKKVSSAACLLSLQMMKINYPTTNCIGAAMHPTICPCLSPSNILSSLDEAIWNLTSRRPIHTLGY